MTGFQVVCDQCDECLASCFCHSDGAFLCPKCDLAVHAVNKIAQRHVRVPHESCPAWAYQDAKSRGRLLELEKPALPKRSSSAVNGCLHSQQQQQQLQHNLNDHSTSVSARVSQPSQHRGTDRPVNSLQQQKQQQQLPHLALAATREEPHTSDSSCNLVSLLDTFMAPTGTKGAPTSLRTFTAATAATAPSHSGNNAQNSGSPMAPASPDTSGENPGMNFSLDGETGSTWAPNGNTMQQQQQCGGRFSVSGSVGGASGALKRPLTDLVHTLPSSDSSHVSATAHQSPCLSPHQPASPSPYPGSAIAVPTTNAQQATAPIDIGSNLICRLGSRGHSSRDTACTLGSVPSTSRLDMSSFGTDSTLIPSAASNAILHEPSDSTHRISTIGSSGSSFLGGQGFQAATTPSTYDNGLARNSSAPRFSEYTNTAGAATQIDHMIRTGSNQAPMTGAFSKEGLAGMLANLSPADLQSVGFTAGSSLPVGASMMLGGGGGFTTQGSSSLAETNGLHGAGLQHFGGGARGSQSMSGTELLSGSYLNSLTAHTIPGQGRGSGADFVSSGLGGFQTTSMSGFGSLHGAGSIAEEYGGSVHGGAGGSMRGGMSGGIGGSLHGGSNTGSVHGGHIGGSLHGGTGGSLHGGIGSSMLGLNIGGSLHGGMGPGGSMHGNVNGLHSAGGSKHGGAGGSVRGGGGYFGSYAENMYGAGFGGSLHGGSILSGLGVGGGLLHSGGAAVHGGSALTTSQSIAALALSLGVSPSSFTDSGLDTLPQLSSETRHVLRGSASASMPISLSPVLPSPAPTIPSHAHAHGDLTFPSWHQQLHLQQQYLESGLAGSYSQAPAPRSSGMAIRAGNTSPFAMDCSTADMDRPFPAYPQNSAPAVLCSLSGEGSVHSGNSFNRTASVNRFRLKRFLRLQALTEAGAKKVRAESRKVLAEAAAARPRSSGRPLRNSASPSHLDTAAYAHSEGSPVCLSPAKGNGCGNTSSNGGASTEGSNLAMACIAEEVDHLEGDSGEDRDVAGRETRHHGSNLWQQHLLLPLDATMGGAGEGRQSQLEARLAMQEQQLAMQQQGQECWQTMEDGHELMIPPPAPSHQQSMSTQSGVQQQQLQPVGNDKDASLTPLQRRWQQQQQQQPQSQPQPQQQHNILPFLLDDDHITDQDLAALGLEDLLPSDLCQGMLDDSEASGDTIYMRPQQSRAPCDPALQQQQGHSNNSTQPMDICGMAGLGRSMFGDLDLCHDNFDAHHHDLLDDPLDCALKVFMSENDMPFF